MKKLQVMSRDFSEFFSHVKYLIFNELEVREKVRQKGQDPPERPCFKAGITAKLLFVLNLILSEVEPY